VQVDIALHFVYSPRAFITGRRLFQPVLTFSIVRFRRNPTTAYIGSYAEVVLSATVDNKGENAYLTTLVVKYPGNASYVGVESAGVSWLLSIFAGFAAPGCRRQLRP